MKVNSISYPNRVYYLLIITAILVVLSGCSRPSERDLVGTYKIEYKPYNGIILDRETLVLNADGTYVQICKASDGRRWHNTGRWRIDRDMGITNIEIDDRLEVVDTSNQLSKQPIRRDSFLGISKLGKKVTISVNDDMPYQYEKVR